MKTKQELREAAAKYDRHLLEQQPVVLDQGNDWVVVVMSVRLFERMMEWLEKQPAPSSPEAKSER